MDDDPADSNPLTWSLGSNDPPQPGSDPGGAYCPVEISLTADADTFVDQDKPDELNGDENKNKTYNTNETPDEEKDKHALIHFDLAPIPPGAIIASATLHLEGNQNRVRRFRGAAPHDHQLVRGRIHLE